MLIIIPSPVCSQSRESAQSMHAHAPLNLRLSFFLTGIDIESLTLSQPDHWGRATPVLSVVNTGPIGDARQPLRLTTGTFVSKHKCAAWISCSSSIFTPLVNSTRPAGQCMAPSLEGRVYTSLCSGPSAEVRGVMCWNKHMKMAALRY